MFNRVKVEAFNMVFGSAGERLGRHRVSLRIELDIQNDYSLNHCISSHFVVDQNKHISKSKHIRHARETGCLGITGAMARALKTLLHLPPLHWIEKAEA